MKEGSRSDRDDSQTPFISEPQYLCDLLDRLRTGHLLRFLSVDREPLAILRRPSQVRADSIEEQGFSHERAVPFFLPAPNPQPPTPSYSGACRLGTRTSIQPVGVGMILWGITQIVRIEDGADLAHDQ